MTKKIKTILLVLLVLGAAGLAALYLSSRNIVVLAPKGAVASEQKDLLIIITLLMLIVVIPVFVLAFAFAWRYREGNTRSKYSPEMDGNRLAEVIWWAIPLAIILIISSIIWRSSHDLDPYKPLESSKKPLTIQVVALEWKWLFIYPEQQIASVNYLQIPEDTPVNFEITADAPMNSFWIPQLGGQVYAMAGMKTKLHLIADDPGEYQGSSANLSGRGFSGMKFIAKAGSQAEFEKWVGSAAQASQSLSLEEYNKLAEPSENNQPAIYSSYESGLYDKIIMKYMEPGPVQQQLDHGHSEANEDTVHGH